MGVMPQFESSIRHFVEIRDKMYNGPFKILEYDKDVSVTSAGEAMAKYFMSKMNLKERQVICELRGNNGIICQAGAMQWMFGNVNMNTGVKGAGDFATKFIRGAASGESAIKPEYFGTGVIALEPTTKYLFIEDVGKWGPGGIVVEDGMFLATESTVQNKIVFRKSFSSAVAGNEGLANCCLTGNGYAVFESNVPEEELIDFKLENDVLKIDGNMAICWSGSLDFTVERSSKSLIGSAASGEGLVNVYRGTGYVRMAPVAAY